MSEATERIQGILTKTTTFAAENKKTLEPLEDLRDFLRSHEEAFYQALGVSDIKELNDRLHDLPAVGKNLNYLDSGGVIYNQIKRDYVLTDATTASREEGQYRNNIFELFVELVNTSEFGQQVIDDLLEQGDFIRSTDILTDFFKALTTVFNNYVIPGEPIRFEFTANATNSLTGYYKKQKDLRTTIKLNFGKSITPLNIKLDKHNFVVESTSSQFTKAVESHLEGTVIPALNNYLGKEQALKPTARSIYIQDSTKWREIVNSYISKVVPDVDLSFTTSIDLNDSASSVSGYLGEVKSSLIFRMAFPQAKVGDVGTEKFAGLARSGEDAPIDTVLEILNDKFNIQVKNVMGNSYTWGELKEKKAMGAISFVYGRLQIPNGEALTEFFGAATYNNLNQKYSDRPGWQEYQNIYSGFQKVFSSHLIPLFDTFIPNIIRLSTYFKEATKHFGQGWNYNNFYLFRGNIVPASLMVQGVIDGINQSADSLFTTQYSMYPGPSEYSPDMPIPSSYTQFANKTKIGYDVTFRFQVAFNRLGL